jgi:hypothetical protein
VRLPNSGHNLAARREQADANVRRCGLLLLSSLSEHLLLARSPNVLVLQALTSAKTSNRSSSHFSGIILVIFLEGQPWRRARC